MNLGIKQAKSEYIVRTDVRCVHPRSYLKDLIALSEQSGADNVGGVLVPTGSAYVQNSIAAAYKSPIAMGAHCATVEILLGKLTLFMEGALGGSVLLKSVCMMKIW